jgi:hypothetical protein
MVTHLDGDTPFTQYTTRESSTARSALLPLACSIHFQRALSNSSTVHLSSGPCQCTLSRVFEWACGAGQQILTLLQWSPAKTCQGQTHTHTHTQTDTHTHTDTLTERRRHKKAQTQIQMLTLHYKSDLCSGKLPLFESCSHARTHARNHAPQARTHARTHARRAHRQTDRQTDTLAMEAKRVLLRPCSCAPRVSDREATSRNIAVLHS